MIPLAVGGLGTPELLIILVMLMVLLGVALVAVVAVVVWAARRR